MKKIVFENLSIKEASEVLRINYSSAKAIASSHKKDKMVKPKRSFHRKNVKVSQYRTLDEDEEGSNVREIVSSIGGLVVSSQYLPKRKVINKIITLNSFNE